MTTQPARRYKSTESQYKGGAQDMYVTYDETQTTRAGTQAPYPKVKRVYVAGQVKGWHVGNFTNRSGRQVHGVKIEYEQSRAGYSRKPYSAVRSGAAHKVSAAKVASGRSHFAKIVEVPKDARNIHFYTGKLPSKYQTARQRVK